MSYLLFLKRRQNFKLSSAAIIGGALRVRLVFKLLNCFRTQDIPFLPSTRTSVSTNQETSPDSTSKIANCETGSHTNQANNEEEDLVFVDKSISPSHQTKLKLQKRKLKRSRYTEVDINLTS